MKLMILVEKDPEFVKKVIEPMGEARCTISSKKLEILIESEKLGELRGKTNAIFKALKIIEDLNSLEG